MTLSIGVFSQCPHQGEGVLEVKLLSHPHVWICVVLTESAVRFLFHKN